MRRITIILLFIFCACFAVSLWAQKKAVKKAEPAAAKHSAYASLVHAYLGHSTLTGGPVTKQVLDSLLKQGITAVDSLGNNYKVTGFRFNYAERHLYEDSAGNDLILTDYMIEYCVGDTLPPSISSNIYLRTKEGDTVYIDQVSLVRPDEGSAAGKAMKFVIVP